MPGAYGAKHFLLLVLWVGLAPGPGQAAIEGDHERTLYAIGARLGNTVRAFGFTSEELETVALGLRDAALGRELAVNERSQQASIDALIRERRVAVFESERAESAAFLERAAAADGAVRTPSGLIVTELRGGSGESPGPGDTVVVHFHGRLRNGNVFDSSVEDGAPARWRLDRVIPCWREGLLRMKPGGKSRLVCPAEIAFGDAGKPPRVQGGAAIVTEVELLEIAK